MSTAPVGKVLGTGAAAATHTTASYTPDANTREVAYVSAFKTTAGVALPTISDTAGNTWTQLASFETTTASNPNIRGVWFISNDVGGSPAARTVTVASTGASAMGVIIADVLTVDVSGSLAQAAVGAEDLATGDPSCTFGSTPGATNITLLGASFGGGNAATKPASFTSIASASNAASRWNSASYDVTSASIGPNQYTSGNIRSLILGIELAPASGGAVNGSLAGTIAAVTQTTTGTVTIQGSLGQTIAAVTLSASGSHSIVLGSLAQTIDPVTQTTTGTLTIQGSLAQTIGPVTQSTTGALTIRGSLGQTIDPVTLVANGSAGGSAINATFNQTIDAFTLVANGSAASLKRDGGAAPRGRSFHIHFERAPEKPAKKVKRRVSLARVKKAIEDLETFDDIPDEWVPTPEAAKLILPDYIAISKTNADDELAIIAAIQRAIIMKAIEEDEEDIEMLLLAA